MAGLAWAAALAWQGVANDGAGRVRLNYNGGISTEPTAMPHFRDLAPDLIADIDEYQDEGGELLRLDRTVPPIEIVTAIHEWACSAQRDEREVDTDEIVGAALLLGEQYVRKFKWHWRQVNLEGDGIDDNYFVCVLPADNRISIHPVGWMMSILQKGRPSNILLNFNMVAAGRVPHAAPGDAIGFH